MTLPWGLICQTFYEVEVEVAAKSTDDWTFKKPYRCDAVDELLLRND